MEKTEITICTGTACYILGGAELLLLEEKMPPNLLDKVIIKGSPCLGLCKNEKAGRPPFVKVNDNIIHEANITKIIDFVIKLSN